MIAALFPGQGSQKIGMGESFYHSSDAAREVFERAEATLPGLLTIMWEGPAEVLQLTANQQPALVTVGAAAFAAYREVGGDMPQFVAGHSLGEFTAHVAAGSLSVEDALKLVRARGIYMQEAVPQGVGAMAAIMKTDRAHVERVCETTRGVVEVANLNSPEQTVISGALEPVEEAGKTLKAEGARVIPLRVSAPFHCSLMQSAAERLAEDLREVRFAEGEAKLVSNVTADLIEVSEAPSLLERQVTQPVRWTESVERLDRLGVDRYFEFGSGKVLTGLVGRILPGAKALALHDMESLKEAL